MKPIFITLTTLMMTSCFASASTISPGLFDKVIDGKILLKETLTTWTFHQGESKAFTGTPLLPINYRQEPVSVAYEDESAALGDYANEVMTFNLQPPSIASFLSGYNFPQTLQHTQTQALLSAMVVTDEGYHQAIRHSRERNLSFDTLEGSYYAFNNYIREENMTLQRYQTPMLFGEGEIKITFQTGFELRPTVIEQISADAEYIYNLRDETYPSGFFGAVDRKIATIRSPGKFKQALTLGPIRLTLDRFIQAEKIYRASEPSTTQDYIIDFSANLQSASQFQVLLAVSRREGATVPDYTYQLALTYQNQGWSMIQEQERLFQ